MLSLSFSESTGSISPLRVRVGGVDPKLIEKWWFLKQKPSRWTELALYHVYPSKGGARLGWLRAFSLQHAASIEKNRVSKIKDISSFTLWRYEASKKNHEYSMEMENLSSFVIENLHKARWTTWSLSLGWLTFYGNNISDIVIISRTRRSKFTNTHARKSGQPPP